MIDRWDVGPDEEAKLVAGLGAATAGILSPEALAALVGNPHFLHMLGVVVGTHVEEFVKGGAIGASKEHEEGSDWKVYFFNLDMDARGEIECLADLRDVILEAPVDDDGPAFAAWLRALADEIEAGAKS